MPEKFDWAGYLRVHSDRRNLLIHLFAVPLFIGAFLVLLASMIRGAYASAVIALVVAIAGMALQARGHAFETHAPEPFSDPGNFLKRWFTEQFVTFPLFVLTGRWWGQFKADGDGHRGAA